MVYVLGKFEVSSSNRFRDMEGSHNFKSRLRDPFAIPFDLILHLFSLVTFMVNKRAKFDVSSSNRLRDIVPKFKK